MNPYLRAAARLREEAEQKMLQRLQEEQAGIKVIERARDELGQFISDDPSTPDVNEAWVEVEQ